MAPAEVTNGEPLAQADGPTEVRPGASQYFLAAGWVAFSLAYWFFDRGHTAGWLWLVIAALFAAQLVSMRWDRVVVGPSGLIVRQQFRRRAWAWTDIERVRRRGRMSVAPCRIEVQARGHRRVTVDLWASAWFDHDRSAVLDEILTRAEAGGAAVGPPPVSPRVLRRQQHNVPDARAARR